MTMDEFLTARVQEDTDLHDDDRQAKLQIIELFGVLDSTDGMHPDAWCAVREVLRMLCVRYQTHQDYNPEWDPKWASVPQRVVLGADQPEAEVTL